MTLVAWIVAIVVGIVAYGLGKLSVYTQQDNERAQDYPDEPALTMEQRQFELWSRAEEDGIATERELSKLICSLSLAGIAGVAALGQLKMLGTPGIVLFSMAFLLPVILCIGNLHCRQANFRDRAAQLQPPLVAGKIPGVTPAKATRLRVIAALPQVGALCFAFTLVVLSFTLPAVDMDCATPRAKPDFPTQLLCSDFLQTLARKPDSHTP